MQSHAGQPVEVVGRPLDETDAVMVMVHGRNASATNILSLAEPLAHPAFTYSAPSAFGNTWYPYGFMEQKERNEPWLTSALSVLHDLVSDILRRGIPAARVVLLGFSQGACLTCEFAVRNAQRYGGVIAYSGGVIGPPGTTWEYDGSFGGTPVFLGCSDVDAHIPRSRVDETAELFERMGAHVTKRIYPGMGHMVNEDELEFTRQLMHGIAS
jgi:predicted esterase